MKIGLAASRLAARVQSDGWVGERRVSRFLSQREALVIAVVDDDASFRDAAMARQEGGRHGVASLAVLHCCG